VDRSPQPSPPRGRREGAPPRYDVRLARLVRVERRGLVCERDAAESLLRFAEVRFAFAAEVGEPEGVSATVFDVVLEGGADPGRLPVVRLDADRGEDARALASALERGAGPDRCSPSLREVASSGYTSHQCLDLESFEADSRAALPKG
jgi:hypothetical protein